MGRVATERLITKHGGKAVSHPGKPGSHIISLIDPLSKPSQRGYTLHSIDYVQSCIDAGKLLELEDFRVPRITHLVHSRNGPSTLLPSPRERRINLALSDPPQRRHSRENGHMKYEEGGTRSAEDSDETGNVNDSRKRQRKAYVADRSRKKSRVFAKQDQYHSKTKIFGYNSDAKKPDTKPDGVNGSDDELTERIEQKIECERNDITPTRPKEDIHRWTMVEDNAIIRLCSKVRKEMSKSDVSAPKLFQSEAWQDLETRGFLPENRSADECRERAEKLYVYRSHELQTRRAEEQKRNNFVVRRPLKSPSTVDDDEIEPIDRKVERKNRLSHSKQGVQAPSPKQSAKRDKLGRHIGKQGDKAKDFIRRNVRLLSSETKMTQRRVFQVLRSTFGDVAEARVALLRERQELEQGKRRRHSKA